MRIPVGNLGNNFKVKRHKFGISMLLFLLLFGVIFTGAGLFALRGTQVDSSWIRVQGQVVDVSSNISDGSTTYNPVVEYRIGGQAYRASGSIGSSAYPVMGSKREVAYNPSQPAQAKVVEKGPVAWLLFIFPVAGIGALLLAPFLFIRSLRRSRNIDNLLQTGHKIQGVLVDIHTTGSNNKRTIYRIIVAATDPTGTVQNYTSDNLTGMPGLAMTDFHNNPIPIDVYLDPADPKNYYVDISDIPSLTADRISELVKKATHSPDDTSSSENPPTATPPLNPNGPRYSH